MGENGKIGETWEIGGIEGIGEIWERGEMGGNRGIIEKSFFV